MSEERTRKPINYDDPVVQAVYGMKPTRKVWYVVERTSGSLNIFNNETARAMFIVDCYEKGQGDTIAKQYEIDFKPTSAPRR